MDNDLTGVVAVHRGKYAFIRTPEGVNYFFIPSCLNKHQFPPVSFDSMRVGDKVSFQHESHERGPRAKNVIVLREDKTCQ